MSFLESAMKAHEEHFKTQINIIPAKIHLFDSMRYLNDQNDLASLGLDMKDEVMYQATSASRLRRYRNLMVDMLLKEYDCDVCIIGTKASDSLHRRTHFTVDGPYLPRERLFSLLWRLKKNAPLQIMLDAKLPIPKYYLWLGRSPDFMLDHEFYFIKKYYPADYEKLCGYLKNLDVVVTKYENGTDFKHALRPSKLLIEAQEAGYPFV